MPETRKVLWSQGITGILQKNGTHIHWPLKNHYRNSDCGLMTEKLQANKHKVPSPTRDKMMSMLADAWSILTVDSMAAFKILLFINALDGSEEHLVSEKLFHLIGTDMLSFPANFLTQQHPESIKGIVKKLIPLKGIKRKEFEGTKFFTDFTSPEEAEVVSEEEESEMSESNPLSHCRSSWCRSTSK